MKARTILLLLVSLAVGDVFAQVNALPPTRHILVYGDAQARAIPDRFKITIDFEEIDVSAQVARDRLQRSYKDVLELAGKSGVPDGEIVATSLEIGPYERYDNKKEEDVYAGVSASRKLTVRFSDTASLEKFLAGIKASEQVQVSGISTELSTEQALKDQLRSKAIESTRIKAEEIAKAYGARIGGLYSVSDVAPQFNYGVREGSWQGSYGWDGDSRTLDRVEVTGSRINRMQTESFKVGYVNYTDKIYAVFLLAD